LFSIGIPEAEPSMSIVIFKDRKKYVKDNYPGEGAANISLL